MNEIYGMKKAALFRTALVSRLINPIYPMNHNHDGSDKLNVKAHQLLELCQAPVNVFFGDLF